MGRFDTIKTTIDANIKENGNQEITGQKMNSILTEMVNATDAELTELESDVELKFSSVISKNVTSYNDAIVKRRHQVSKSAENAEGNRFSVVFKCSKGDSFFAQSTYDKGIVCVVYDTIDNFCVGGVQGKLQSLTDGYTTEPVKGTIDFDGYVGVKWAKSDDSAITDAEMQDMLDSLNISIISSIQTEIDNIETTLGGGVRQRFVNFGWIAADGTSNHTTDGATHFVVEVKEGDVVEISMTGSSNGVYALLKSYSGTMPENKKYDLFSENRPIIYVGTNVSLKIAAGCNYLLLGTSVDGLQRLYDLKINNTTIDIQGGKFVFPNRLDSLEATIGKNITSYVNAEVIRRHQVSTSIESATGNRLSVVFKCSKGDSMSVQSTYDKGIVCVVYDTIDNFCKGGVNGKLQSLTDGYTTEPIKGIIEHDGYVGIKWAKTDDSAITDAEMQDMLDSLNIKLSSGLLALENADSSSIVVSGNSAKQIPLGTWLPNSLNGNGQISSNSTTIVAQASCVAVPEYNVRVIVKIPAAYRMAFKFGETTTGMDLALSADSGYLSNGQTYQFPANGQMFRAYLSKVDGTTISVAEINRLTESGDIAISFVSNDGNVVVRNVANERYIKNIQRLFTSVSSNNGQKNLPVFAHMSDIHSDVTRFNSFLDYCDFLGVDAALVTGDVLAMSGKDGADYINAGADSHKSEVLLCMGNHDARGNNTEESQYNNIMKHLMDKVGVVTPSISFPTYFHKDYDSLKIRAISFNQYMAGQSNTNTWHYSQKQLNWLIQTLQNTPVGYGVLLLMHSPENAIMRADGYDKFYHVNTSNNVTSYIETCPLAKIVDAFISRTSVQIAVNESTSEGAESYSVNANFANVADGVEFIAFVCGHMHHDRVGHVSNTNNNILILNVGCGIGLYGTELYRLYCELMDVPRGGNGVTQDLFNIYAIDRESKSVRIARVGSNMTSEFKDRDFMIIPYV